MIILKFTEGQAQAETIDKPLFQEGLEKILMEMYTESIAKRNADEIAKYIRDNMRFPKNGLYCIKDGKLNRYDSSKNAWVDTKTTTSDYVVTPESEIWSCFNGEFLYLQDINTQIKEFVKQKTQEMFDIDTWRPVSSVDSRSWIFYYNRDGIAHMLESFFTQEKSIAIANDIRRQLFGVKDSDVVILQEGWSIKSAISANDVRVFDENNIKKAEQIFKSKLKQSEISELMVRLKNLLCFGEDISIGEIIEYTDEEYRIVKYKGYEIVFILGDPFIKVNESVFADIKRRVDSIDFHQGAKKGEHGYEYMSLTEIDLTIPSENGINLLAKRDNMELIIQRKIPNAYSCWGEKFVELKYVKGKEKRTYYKEDFIGHYVRVKL